MEGGKACCIWWFITNNLLSERRMRNKGWEIKVILGVPYQVSKTTQENQVHSSE